MPELPEVETTMRALAARLAGRRRDRRWCSGAPTSASRCRNGCAARLTGRTMVGLRAPRQVHPGLSRRRRPSCCCISACPGRLRVRRRAVRPARASDLQLRRRHHPALRRPAPLRHARSVAGRDAGPQHRWLGASRASSRSTPASTAGAWRTALAGRRSALKVALMDQRLVVGVGNIYASESLFRARLCAAPRRPAASGRARRSGWPRSVRQVLRRGDRGRRLVACATMSSPTASSATSSATSGSTTAPASPARAAADRSSGSCRVAGRPSGARSCQR